MASKVIPTVVAGEYWYTVQRETPEQLLYGMGFGKVAICYTGRKRLCNDLGCEIIGSGTQCSGFSWSFTSPLRHPPGIEPLLEKGLLLLLRLMSPTTFTQHRELILLASDLHSVFFLLGHNYSYSGHQLALLYPPKQALVMLPLRQVLVPVRPPAAFLRGLLLAPVVLWQFLRTSPQSLAVVVWAYAHPAAAVLIHGVVLVAVGLVASYLADLKARRAFVLQRAMKAG
jgi:hypothetical protein